MFSMEATKMKLSTTFLILTLLFPVAYASSGNDLKVEHIDDEINMLVSSQESMNGSGYMYADCAYKESGSIGGQLRERVSISKPGSSYKGSYIVGVENSDRDILFYQKMMSTCVGNGAFNGEKKVDNTSSVKCLDRKPSIKDIECGDSKFYTERMTTRGLFFFNESEINSINKTLPEIAFCELNFTGINQNNLRENFRMLSYGEYNARDAALGRKMTLFSVLTFGASDAIADSIGDDSGKDLAKRGAKNALKDLSKLPVCE